MWQNSQGRDAARRQYQGSISRANGLHFEEIIDAGCNYYRVKGAADIEKTPEPMQPTKDLGGGKFIAHYTSTAQADYQGFLLGLHEGSAGGLQGPPRRRPRHQLRGQAHRHRKNGAEPRYRRPGGAPAAMRSPWRYRLRPLLLRPDGLFSGTLECLAEHEGPFRPQVHNTPGSRDLPRPLRRPGCTAFSGRHRRET